MFGVDETRLTLAVTVKELIAGNSQTMIMSINVSAYNIGLYITYMVYAVSLVETKQPPSISGILDLLISIPIHLLFIEYIQYALI